MAFPTGWGRKCIITIPNAQISGNNSNFPVLITEVNLPAEMVDGGASSALNGGGDVRVSEDSVGTVQVPLDIFSFVTGGTPSVEMWTKLPTVNTGADKIFYVWYKNTGQVQPPVTDPMGRNAVWSEAETAVLMESATPVDRTGNHALTLTGSLTNITGPFGRANSFAGTDRLSNTDPALKDILTTYNTTVSTVSRRPSYVSGWYPAMSCEGTDNFLIYPMDIENGNGLRIYWGDLGSNIIRINNESLANTWIHNSFTTRASNDHQAYTNGSSVAATSATGTAGPFTTFRIGGWSGQNFDGDIAQVIVWKAARTTGWITTGYNNQFNPSLFSTAGTPEAVGGGVVTLTIDAGVSDHSADNAALTQFQAININGVILDQVAEGVILGQEQITVINSAVHDQITGNPVLLQSYWVNASAALQAVTSEDVTLMQLQALIIQNTIHGLSSDVVGLFDSAGYTANPNRMQRAGQENRTLPPISGDRITQPTNN